MISLLISNEGTNLLSKNLFLIQQSEVASYEIRRRIVKNQKKQCTNRNKNQ